MLNGYLGAMGKAGDPNAVVDSHARVFGVQGLRVVDASAFPFLPPGHAQAIVCTYTPRCPAPRCTFILIA